MELSLSWQTWQYNTLLRSNQIQACGTDTSKPSTKPITIIIILNGFKVGQLNLNPVQILVRYMRVKPGPSPLSASLTAALEAPALCPPVPSSPVCCCSVALPVGPLASCSQFLCSSAGTHAGAQAPPGNPDNAHPHWLKPKIYPWILMLDIVHLRCSVYYRNYFVML